jgi:hypothetical protein
MHSMVTPRARNPPRIHAFGAGGTGIAPATCGFGVRLVPSTVVGVCVLTPDFLSSCHGACRLVSACVALGCCQICCQSSSVFWEFLLVCSCLSAQAHQRRLSAPNFSPIGTESTQSKRPSPSLTIKVPSIADKIEQGGRLRDLLPQLSSPDQIVADATGFRPSSRDVALGALIPNQSCGAHIRSNNPHTVACAPHGQWLAMHLVLPCSMW